MIVKILLVLWSAVAFLLVRRCRRLLSSRIKKPLWFILEFALFLLLAYNCIGGPSPLWFLNLPEAGLYTALFGDMAGEVLQSIYRRIIGINNADTDRISVQMPAAAMFSVLFLLYGMINMETVSAGRHVIESEKVTESVSFAYICDVHAGTAQSFQTFKKTVGEIKREPEIEFVVLGGDITDEYTKREEMERVYELFGEIETPVYFVYGNHDRQDNAGCAYGRQYSEEDLRAALERNGIRVLADEYAEVGEELLIFGREDASRSCRKPASRIVFPNPSGYNIVFDHQPHQHEDIMETGADLQVSGHLHDAQFWPLQYLYPVFGYETSGKYVLGDTILYVSPGAAGWKIPMRTSGRCRYEVFTIKPVEVP